jgi:hypothetical protein
VKHSVVSAATIVQGSIEAPAGAEVGVTVNGLPAMVNGHSFAFIGLPPDDGVREPDDEEEHPQQHDGKRGEQHYRIQVKAVTGEGKETEKSIEVTAVEPFLSESGLFANPATGESPLAVRFMVGDIYKSQSRYELDYEGDGTVDLVADSPTTLEVGLNHTYQQNGLYFPTLTVTASTGSKSMWTVLVSVSKIPDLKAKWDEMRTALAAGQIESAVKYFTTGNRDSYQRAFSAIAETGRLAEVAAGMADLVIVRTEGDNAEGDLQIIKNGKTYSHHVKFEKDTDGIWRIRAF